MRLARRQLLLPGRSNCRRAVRLTGGVRSDALARQIRIAFGFRFPLYSPVISREARSRPGRASSPECYLPSPCCLLRSADADSQTSWRNAGGVAGERRGGCARVTAPPETAEIAALRVKAKAGDVDAQSDLGYAYRDGQGVPQDDAQAAAWFRKAAEQRGDAADQYNLGLAYANGKGVPQDYAQAAAWFRKAAEQGHAAAQCGASGGTPTSALIRRSARPCPPRRPSPRR